MYKGKARAYTNIALIKYWGKQDETFILPMNNSLSLTLDAFYTETTVAFSPDFTQDRFTLDGVGETDAATKNSIKYYIGWCGANRRCHKKSCGLFGSGTKKSGLPVVCHGGKSKLRPNRCWTCLFCQRISGIGGCL